jgi:aminoglycoside 6'-N-acetyltransferase I
VIGENLGPMLTVRRAQAADRPEHARMRAALWPDEDPAELASELETLLADSTQAAFVAERDDGRLCGFAEASVRAYANSNDEAPCAFLEGLWVDEDVRRRGVGRALVAAVEDWARANGFTELGSDALVDNSVSHAAHHALGFEERERVVYFRKWL